MISRYFLISRDYYTVPKDHECYEALFNSLTLILGRAKGLRRYFEWFKTEQIKRYFKFKEEQDPATVTPEYPKYFCFSFGKGSVSNKRANDVSAAVEVFKRSRIFSKAIVEEEEVKEYGTYARRCGVFGRDNDQRIYIDLEKISIYEFYLFLYLARSFFEQWHADINPYLTDAFSVLSPDEGVLLMCLLQSSSKTHRALYEPGKELRIYTASPDMHHTLFTFAKGMSRIAIRKLVDEGSLEGFSRDFKRNYKDSNVTLYGKIDRANEESYTIDGSNEKVWDYNQKVFNNPLIQYRSITKFFGSTPSSYSMISKVQFPNLPPVEQVDDLVKFVKDIVEASRYRRKRNLKIA